MRNCVKIPESGGREDFFNLSKAINYIAELMPSIPQKMIYTPKKRYDKKIFTIANKFYSNQIANYEQIANPAKTLGFYAKRNYVISIFALNGINKRQIRECVSRRKGDKAGEYFYFINLKLYDKIVVLIYKFLHRFNCKDQINFLYQDTLKYTKFKDKDIVNVFIPRQYSILKEINSTGGFNNFLYNKPAQQLIERLKQLRIDYSVIVS